MLNEGSFEGKLHGFRRTADGVVISYVVHPNDVSAAMATASLGTRYMIGFSELTDSEPTGNPARSGPYKADTGPNAGIGVTGGKDRRKFSDLPLCAQAGIRSDEPEFGEYLETIMPIHDQESFADAVRAYCGVDTRAKILPGTDAGAKWLALEAQYQAWLTDRKYAGMRK